MANYSTLDSRQKLHDYCLRRLGYPVVEVNVSDDQIQDRIDDALQYYFEHHSEGQHRLFVKYTITQKNIETGRIDFDDIVNNEDGQRDLNPQWASIGNRILNIARIFPINDSTSSVNFFDIKYQMRLNDMSDLMTGVGDLAYYEQMQQYLATIDLKLTGSPQHTYLRRENILLIEGDLRAGGGGDLKKDDIIMIEVYVRQRTDGSADTLYDEVFLKEYATQLIKKQWGENVAKFEGVTLPGGVTINGQRLIDEANTEIEKILERLQNEYDLPPQMFVG